MKKAAWLIILVLLINTVYASESIFVKDTVKEGESAAYRTDSGIYIIELLIVSGQVAKFKVNNQILNTIGEGDGDTIADGSELRVDGILNNDVQDEVEFYFYGSGKAPLDVELDKNWIIEDCNFDESCDETETTQLCCYDCGCEPGYKCERNVCIKKEGCINNEECDDKNPCTTDSCEETKCKYEKKDGCKLDDECADYGAAELIGGIKSYCSEYGWQEKKEAGEVCSNDYECLTNSCKENKCYKRSFKALLITVAVIALLLLMLYAAKKAKLYKKIKRRLFWRF